MKGDYNINRHGKNIKLLRLTLNHMHQNKTNKTNKTLTKRNAMHQLVHDYFITISKTDFENETG